jgi:SNF2 family DNA or RNA helicase
MRIPAEVITEIRAKALNFFNELQIQDALKLIERSKLQVSFQKGNIESYFIISGIIQDESTYEAKTIFKEGTLKTSCKCKYWTEEHHCNHTAALFIKFHINEKIKMAGEESQERPEYSSMGSGVHCERYGTLIESAHRLPGAFSHSTFSSLNYILTSRKMINLPVAENFTGKLIVDLKRLSEIEELKTFPNADTLFMPIFSYRNGDEVTKEISLFDYLYIFDWKKGKLFNIPDDIRELIKKIKNGDKFQELNDFLRKFFHLKEKNYIEVYWDGMEYAERKHEIVKYRFDIEPTPRKNHLQFNIQIYDEENLLLTPPLIFETLAFDFGLLSTFRSKNDAFKFLESIRSSLTENFAHYRKFVHSSSAKEKINEIFDFLMQYSSIPFTSGDQKKIYFLDTNTFKIIIIKLLEIMSEQSFKFSTFDTINKKLSFDIPKQTLFAGIAVFHKVVSPMGYEIFYNQNQIRNWSSNIRFERRKSDLDWFGLDLIVSNEDFEIIKNAEIGQDYILTENGLILLEQKEKELLKFMKKYSLEGEKKIDADKAKRFTLNFRRSRIFELFELKKFGIEGALTPEEEKLCYNLLHMNEMPKFEIPERFKNIARHYQEDGYQWLRFLFENKFGACLADDMGLGKTLQTIMFLQSIQDRIKRVLIVCPVSIIMNWQQEIKKFSDLDLEVYYGGEREFNPKHKILLTSYGIMKKESFDILQNYHFDIVIFDEVQQLKNIRSQGANAARTLNANFRICLTGTPVENDLSEFYNIMDLAVPGVWGEIGLFKTTSNKKSRLLARQTVRPFILRRTKDQVLKELPEKIEQHIYLNFSETELNNYKNRLIDIQKRVTEVQTGRKYGEILKSLLELRQLCLWQKQSGVESTKIEYLIENLSQLVEEGHKTIVFSQFTTYLDLIQDKVREQGWKYARIDGSQSFKKRADEVDRFQKGDAQIFLISLKAGGVGLNLTAASYIFLMDPWWNPAVENQAIDRAHRIGQENKVTVYRPIIKNTVEEKVLVLQNDKKELFKDLMAEDDNEFFNGKLSMKDFQSLLSL